jgi:hypothetical protein
VFGRSRVQIQQGRQAITIDDVNEYHKQPLQWNFGGVLQIPCTFFKTIFHCSSGHLRYNFIFWKFLNILQSNTSDNLLSNLHVKVLFSTPWRQAYVLVHFYLKEVISEVRWVTGSPYWGYSWLVRSLQASAGIVLQARNSCLHSNLAALLHMC